MQRKLSSKQRAAAFYLTRGWPQYRIAQELKVRPKTLWRWKQFPEFQEEYERLMKDMKEELHQRLLIIGALALENVTNSLLNDNHSLHTSLMLMKQFGMKDLLAPSTQFLPKPAEIIRNP